MNVNSTGIFTVIVNSEHGPSRSIIDGLKCPYCGYSLSQKILGLRT
jgi:hypothetical protein